MKRLIPILALFTLVCTLACTNAATKSSASGDALVVGTVVDAATGAPEAHVRVEGPDGTSARSDEHGRFTLKGLSPGADGEVSAKSDDGRTARIRLRHLSAGQLEVVLQLAAH